MKEIDAYEKRHAKESFQLPRQETYVYEKRPMYMKRGMPKKASNYRDTVYE